jgi:amino acid transporter
MNNLIDISSVAHVIQLAVAPVFLLTGIGAILGVLSTRLGRVIDRYRVLSAMDEMERIAHHGEMRNLQTRSKWIHGSITLCTVCALLVCLVIAALFVGAELGRDPSLLIAALFTAAMLALIAGLVAFLREIALATGVISQAE